MLIIVVFLSTSAVGTATAGSIPISQNDDGLVLTEPGGPSITLTGDTSMYTATGSVDSSTVQWNTTAGNATFSAPDPASATIAATDLAGTWTNATAVDVSGTTLTIDPADKESISVSGSVTAVRYRQAADISLDDGGIDFGYAATGDGTITLSNLPANTQFNAANTAGDPLGTYTTDGSGTVTIDVSSTGGSDVGVHLFSSASAPQASNFVPANETGLSQESTEFTADISDEDFARGDSVTATLFTKAPSTTSFSQTYQTTVSSNTTVSTTVDLGEGGGHEYYWTLSDGYSTSADTTTDTRTVFVPDELRIFNESEDPTLLTNVSATIQFYSGDETIDTYIERTTSDGTVNMTGLPANQEFVATVSAPGYESRRIFIRSLYTQQRVYLLNNTTDSSETIFEMLDYSGRFPPDETVLEIRRAMNGSWQTVSGDYFGSTAEYPTTLETGARYRLRLFNPSTGAERPIGTYQPIAAQTQTIEVSPDSEVEDLQILPVATIEPQTRRVPALNDTQISASLSQVENVSVESWRVIVVRNSTTIINRTYDGSTQRANLTADLGGFGGEQVTVSVVATLSDGRIISAGDATLSVYESPTNNLSLLALIVDFVGLAAPGTAGALTSFLAAVLTIFVMGGISTQLPVSGEATALAGVLTLTAFSVIGWVGYGMVFIAGSAVIAFAALRRGL
ncbi:hypothetical protein EI982_14645 [Haloplanus rallus]|uniref:Uncharacterized protein n=1 Tax=Haloplanus rallus TaxID=1816183 RepID=A0A6B9FB89_9EURY|nr:hypothetical protein [Haloplanus rallus]QGX95934.1 hypothetical protein EI982_14645 [Haloplanus rallus]